jgi:nicotinamidase/pyrazinamidase
MVDLPGVKGQVLWPDHCIQGSEGARFHEGLDLRPVILIVRKGFRRELDSYSAFFENDRRTPTGLDGFLRGLSVDTLYIGGLATDYCVFYSAMDALRLGYKTRIIADAVRGVAYPEGSVEAALAEMEKAGAVFVNSGDIR